MVHSRQIAKSGGEIKRLKGAFRPKGASVKCTNLVSGFSDHEDDLEMLALPEGHLAFLFLSPPARLK